MLRKSITCSSCLQEGHMKNSNKCILYQERLNNIHNLITDELKAYILTMMESKTYKLNDDERLKNLFNDEDIKVNTPMTEAEIVDYLNETKKIYK
jgi:hypothetical protein